MLYLVINNNVIYNTESGTVGDALDSISRHYLGKQYDIRDVYPCARVFARATSTDIVYLGTVEDLG